MSGWWGMFGICWGKKASGRYEKNLFPMKTVTQWNTSPRGCNLYLWTFSKPDWTRPWPTCSDLIAELSLNHRIPEVPSWVVLWSCQYTTGVCLDARRQYPLCCRLETHSLSYNSLVFGAFSWHMGLFNAFWAKKNINPSLLLPGWCQYLVKGRQQPHCFVVM